MENFILCNVKMQLQEDFDVCRKMRLKRFKKNRNISKITDNKTYLFVVSESLYTVQHRFFSSFIIHLDQHQTL